MFRFANPEYLYLLFLVPLLALLYAYSAYRARKSWERFADRDFLPRLVPDYSRKHRLLKFILVEVALALLVVMLARPQKGLVEVKDSTAGIEAVFVLDVSNSMLAQDVQPNRLERSKLLVSTLVDRMRNDKVALAVFAGEAYPQLPITNDYVSAKLFLDNISPGMVTLQGTNLAAAINLARISFTDNKDVGKAIIIITDGENHEEGAQKAAEEAAKAGMKIFILGVGSTTGSKIPLSNGGFLCDESGMEVTTRLNEEMCREVAKAGNGLYLHVDNSNYAQQQLQAQLDQLKKANNGSSYASYDEQFRAVAILVIVLLLLELLISERKNPLFKKIKLFSK